LSADAVITEPYAEESQGYNGQDKTSFRAVKGLTGSSVGVDLGRRSAAHCVVSKSDGEEEKRFK
jgi:hypothetical protein